MTPIGEPFDPTNGTHPETDAADSSGPGQATPVPARAACRPWLTARRADPPQR